MAPVVTVADHPATETLGKNTAASTITTGIG